MDGIKREMIENAPFQHFNPWSLVMKMDSVTTPELPDLDPELIIREETTVRNLDPSFGIDDENLSDLTEECYSPGRGGTRAQIEQTRSLLRDEKTTVRNPVCKTQPTLDWMKSSKDDKFSGTMANAGRGVAELLVDPVSQGWRTKPSQKEFLKKLYWQ